jgi:hypothetical protein
MENLTETQSSTFITDETYVSTILSEWDSYVQNNESLESLFTYNGEKIYGWGMSFLDYVSLIGTPNCHNYKVRFGYDPLETDSFKFKMLVWGVDLAGDRVTAYCCPQVKLTSTPLTLVNGGDPVGGLVAPQMAQCWLDNWEELSDYDAGTFKVTVYPEGDIEVLRGYNYSSSDFHKVIDAAKATIENVFFLNVCHDIVPANEDEAPNLFGTMIAAMNDGKVISNYYDLSAPCPKTC